MERHAPATLRRARRLSRLVGALVGLLGGVFYALYLISSIDQLNARLPATVTLAAACLIGFLVGGIAGPSLSVEPFLWVEDTLAEAPPAELVGGLIGLLLALIVSALVGVPLQRLPSGVGLLVTVAFTIVAVYVGVGAGAGRRRDLEALTARLTGVRDQARHDDGLDVVPPVGTPAVVDTSVLIDGRVLDVARTGFLPAVLLLPGFVLEELQRIADAGDPLRRAKGRRGLATVEGLQALGQPRCEVVDIDFPGVPEVDSRLIRLARARGAAVMTNDFMLNRLAQIEGLRVLNLNDLALALKPIVSAGETMQVTIVKEGKELHQGVGYLDDGTMVVVENGRSQLDQTVTATVTSVIQTPAGRMIFAAVPPADNRDADPARPLRPRGHQPARPRVVNR